MVHQADDVPPEALRFCQKSAPERGKTQRSTAGHLVLAARRAMPQLLLAAQRIASGLPGTPNQASLLRVGRAAGVPRASALAVARVVGLNLEFNTWGVGLYRSVLAVRLLTVNTDLSPGSLLY